MAFQATIGRACCGVLIATAMVTQFAACSVSMSDEDASDNDAGVASGAGNIVDAYDLAEGARRSFVGQWQCGP